MALSPTKRQIEALQAFFRHGSVKDAAREMGISHRTVKRLLHELYIRIGVESSHEAAYHLWLHEYWGDGAD
jgi:DNA-binding NarL/FixJ family response regulator